MVVSSWIAVVVLLRHSATSQHVFAGLCGIQYGFGSDTTLHFSNDNFDSNAELVRSMGASLAMESNDVVDRYSTTVGVPT